MRARSPADTVPYWIGAHSIPRVLELAGDELLQYPVPELETLRGPDHRQRDLAIMPGTAGHLESVASAALELELTVDLRRTGAHRFGATVRVASDGRGARVWYQPAGNRIGVDRLLGAEQVYANPAASQSGDLQGSSEKLQAPLVAAPAGTVHGEAGTVTLRIFVDRSILEVYCGGAALTDRLYPEPSATGVDDATFAGTDIGQDPTQERSRYVTLRFDFSAVKDKIETLEREFEIHCHTELEGTLERHPDLFPEAALQRILSPPSITGKLGRLFRFAGDHDVSLYVLIDEYDNFANTVLAHHGAEAYHAFTHGGGFYRNFFATLKSGTARSGGGIDRLFITGVSPVTMDDVTSGFNIGTNISLDPDFNEMVGFTEAEVRRLVETYRECGVFDQDVDAAMGIMGDWYNGYRFSKAAETDLYNTDMVLYYLKHSIPNRPVPDDLIDTNVRIGYGKLRHLLWWGGS